MSSDDDRNASLYSVPNVSIHAADLPAYPAMPLDESGQLDLNCLEEWGRARHIASWNLREARSATEAEVLRTLVATTDACEACERRDNQYVHGYIAGRCQGAKAMSLFWTDPVPPRRLQDSDDYERGRAAGLRMCAERAADVSTEDSRARDLLLVADSIWPAT